jgi:hypothetical protein
MVSEEWLYSGRWNNQKVQHAQGCFTTTYMELNSDNATREILDSGLVLGACYTIYSIRSIQGLQLLQLRNPPGDHDEWKGDW